MILTIIESPFASPTPAGLQRNVDYVRACMRDALIRGEAPFASHALYTLPGVLDDTKPEERTLGIESGLLIGDALHAAIAEATSLSGAMDESFRVVFYVDLGWSSGMKMGLERAQRRGSDCFTRTLGAPWSELAASMERLVPS